MSKRRSNFRSPAHAARPKTDATQPPAHAPRLPAPRQLEIDILAVLAVLLCLALGYATRNALNPDGVSYLDLAAALQRGDWSAFVQAYWSPMLPVLLALTGLVTSAERTAFLPAVHLLNAIVACAGIAVIWRWGHRRHDRIFARAALAAFILAAARPLRLEAVTPDILLLSLCAWIGYELLVHSGQRWARLGVLLGLAFLAKTSVWPWLLVITLVRVGVNWSSPIRNDVFRTALVAALVMAPWVAAISVESGHFTLTSAGRLNVCWYMQSCDGRTPDTHQGGHRVYREAALTDGATVTVATFNAERGWTYEPWSDPTAWASGIVTQQTHRPAVREVLQFWSHHVKYIVGFWMLPVLAGVLLPFILFHWPRQDARSLGGTGRDAAMTMFFGIMGIGQFVAVHAEPRLIAPFVLLFALGALTWLRDAAVPDVALSGSQVLLRHAASTVGLVIVLVLGAQRLDAELSDSALIDQRFATIAAQIRADHPAGANRLAVIGYAVPALGDAWRAGLAITVQVPPRSAIVFGRLPPAQMMQELRTLLRGHADLAWLINPDGRFQRVKLDEP